MPREERWDGQMVQHEMSRGGENIDGELDFRVDSANSNTARVT